MKLSSTAFKDGDVIPTRFTCDGENLSPPLQWSRPPKTAKSFALVCEDPDAPGGNFMHWVIYDIPAGWSSLPEGATPVPLDPAINEAINDFHNRGYGGPCPPHDRGAHRYQFHLWALGVERLNLPANPTCAELKREARRQAVADATLQGVYER